MTKPPDSTPEQDGAEVFTASAPVMVLRVLWLVRLRWFVACLIALLGAAVWVVTGTPSSVGAWTWLAVLASLTAAHNVGMRALLGRMLHRGQQTGKHKVAGVATHILFTDILVWAFVLHFTGGATTALAAVPLVYVAVGASLLRRVRAFALAGFACATYLAQAVLEDRLPAGPAPEVLRPQWFDLVLVGTACAAIVTIVYFTAELLTRLRSINRRLVEANRQLAALELTKSRFLRVSSHQLRSPLAAIHSMLSAIQEVGALSPKQFDLMRRIRIRAEDIMTQLDEMMLLSTIKESAAETERRAPVVLDEVLGEAVAAYRDAASQKNLHMTLEAADRGATISAWPDAVETIFEHLVSNAVKYTPAGGRVTVQAVSDKRWAEVTVSDTGIGIPAEQQDQAFREFFRGTNARQQASGTGLGLSIVKAIVERLDGELELKSSEQEGTTITVRLPLASGVEASASGEAAKQDTEFEPAS